MASGNLGMSGRNFDAFVSSQRTFGDQNWALKIQEKYWLARQKFLAKVERNEDACIVMSDSKLDAQLGVYHSVDKTCSRLINILEDYQNSLFVFANEENALGILLKECGKLDKTKAGKILSYTGKSLTQSSHERIRLYMPLLRFHQEIETFQSRAVEDTGNTVEKLESKRSQYRASLLWMKNISETLNPDVYKQLDKFRRVQNQVRIDKRVFDGMQIDVVQKIDLLVASRCNLFNQILAPYQTIMRENLEKNYNNFKSVEAMIRDEDIHEYEFKALKQLNPLRLEHTPEYLTTQKDLPDLLGDFDATDKSVDNNPTSNDELIDITLEKVTLNNNVEEREPDDTLGMLEQLFGNSTPSTSKPTSETTQGNNDKDSKLFRSNLHNNLLDLEDEDRQVADLLGPSENPNLFIKKVD